MKNLFYKIGTNFWKPFSGYYILFHIIACIGTAVIVLSGFDWKYFVEIQKYDLRLVMTIVMMTGMFLPVFTPIILFILGCILKKTKLTITAAIIGQSAFLGWVISSIYKALTGRVHPDYENTVIDISRNFDFGFWKNGIVWGWPSSHTTTSFAIAIALVFAFPENKVIRLLAPFYAMCIGLGTTIGAHWFSEFFAGIFIGTAIGIVVGKSFRVFLK